MGSSCSSSQKKDKERSKKKKKGCSPEGRRRSSVKSTDSLPYGKDSTPPQERSGIASATAGDGATEAVASAPVNITSPAAVQHNGENVASPPAHVMSPAQGNEVPLDDGLPSLQSSFPEDVHELLMGHLGEDEPCGSHGSRLISLYVCSGLPDMELERSHLTERVYPQVRTYCAERGCDFNVVDLHWGVNTDGLDRVFLTDLCLGTISRLQREGHFLVLVLLNEKLEHPLPHILPSSVPSADFTAAVESFESTDLRDLLLSWYVKDDNSVPQCHVLRAIRERIPDIVSNDPGVRTAAVERWQKEAGMMLDAFRSTFTVEQRTTHLQSVVEQELQAAVMPEWQKPIRCLWMERRFTHRGPQRSNSVVGAVVESEAQPSTIDLSESKRYNVLRAQLEDRLPESQKLVVRVKWTKDGINTKDHAEYLDEVCDTLLKEFTNMISSVLEDDLAEETNRPCRGIEEDLHLELTQQMRACRLLSSTFAGQAEALEMIHKYLKGEGSHPLVVHGPSGCGKSALVARAVQLCEQWLPDTPVVARLVGVSPCSSTQHQLLRSICEQCCALYGVHPISASRSIEELKESLGELLDRVSAQRPLVLFIDALDQVLDYSSRLLDWLPAELPQYVKLVLTIGDGSKEFLELQNKLKDKQHCFLPLAKCSVDDSKQILREMLDKHNRLLTSKQHDLIRSYMAQTPTPLLASFISKHAIHWRSCDTTDKIIKRTVEEIVSEAFARTEEHVGPKVVSFVLGLLSSSRHGLSDSELVDILSCQDALLGSVPIINGERTVRRCPFAVWAIIRQSLCSLLKSHIVGGNVLTTWRGEMYRTLCLQRVNDETVQTCRMVLVDYFQSHPASVASCCLLDQPMMFSTFPNRRKLDELPYYCIQLMKLVRDKVILDVKPLLSRLHGTVANGPADAEDDSGELLNQHVREQFFFNADWLQCKVQGSDPQMLLEELDMYLALNPSDMECALLRDLIQLCSYAFRYDGRQFSAQISARMGSIMANENEHQKYPRLKALYDNACRSMKSSLVPVTNHLREPLAPQTGSSTPDEEAPSLGQLYPIKGEAAHMVSLVRNEMVVWNVIEERRVRRLVGVTEPRDLKMVDRYRALVLCNRELKVYSLDEGRLLVKLKGVMNQKMAYFGLHSQDYVVALSRNRMYVNMLNLNSGDLETTFKVGEDRFLNSLLVSGNGKICVCGDETQKPFPLLVWDLASRKLLYDLRIPHHEFLTRLSAISDDGHYVVCVCRELSDSSPNFIIVYDLQSGTLFKKWKPERNSCSIAISSQGGCVVNGLDNCFLLIWDLTTGARRYTLRGHIAPVDQIRLDESGFKALTYNSKGIDRSIRIWDVMKGECLAVFTPDLAISCCELTLDGRAVAMGLENHDGVYCHILCQEGQTLAEARPALQVFGNPAHGGNTFDVSEQG
ncbi:NACHT domain- and WD repeat-containing protein 1-like isoform X2 [Ornithodoros turicata]|uniref:NACHT domain- and WD repeat-containing protein 1-like isoform X2 n=1 Tax=Ornithodoros turicata TaxID=34597 RepID=UPI003138A6AC